MPTAKYEHVLPRCVVIGNPVSHSWSPWIHAQFALHYQLDVDYRHFLGEVGPHAFRLALDQFITQEHSLGVNITLPFKQDAYAFVSKHSCIAGESLSTQDTEMTHTAKIQNLLELARNNNHYYAPEVARRMLECLQMVDIARSVNTLMYIKASSQYLGFNTDGLGMIDAMHDFGIPIDSMAHPRILILGAGGAARTVLAGLLRYYQSGAHICVANRTPSRAQNLVSDYSLVAQKNNIVLKAYTLDNLENQEFALIINTSSAGHSKADLAVKGLTLAKGAYCMDLNYGPAVQSFLDLCSRLKCTHERFCDGLSMLVYQAHHAFSFWHAGIEHTLLEQSGDFLSDVIKALRQKIEAGEKLPSRCTVVKGIYREYST